LPKQPVDISLYLRRQRYGASHGVGLLHRLAGLEGTYAVSLTAPTRLFTAVPRHTIQGGKHLPSCSRGTCADAASVAACLRQLSTGRAVAVSGKWLLPQRSRTPPAPGETRVDVVTGRRVPGEVRRYLRAARSRRAEHQRTAVTTCRAIRRAAAATGRFVFARGITGNMEASAAKQLSRPYTRP